MPAGRIAGSHHRPDTSDAWPKQCPSCHRHTWPRTRMVNKPVPMPDWAKARGDVQASLIDGTCSRCYTPSARRDAPLVATVAANGHPLPPKPIRTGERRPAAKLPKHKLTDEEITDLRLRLMGMMSDRRARGVPIEGLPVEDWARGNGGLYASEIG